MREILFRGKREDNGEWVCGQLLFFESSVGKKNFALIVEGCEWCNANEWFNLGKRAKVIPKSIGQFTSMCDKNGKKIFEGDIVKHYNNSDDVFDIGVIYFDKTFLGWRRTTNGNFHKGLVDTYKINTTCTYEVIGNIHDNPELLKGE